MIDKNDMMFLRYVVVDEYDVPLCYASWSAATAIEDSAVTIRQTSRL